MRHESSRAIKAKLQSSNSYKHIDFNTSQNNFQSKANDINQTIKVDFVHIDNSYSNISMNKTVNNIDSRTEVEPVERDIYYDKVVYYDGGDVKGYGYDE